MAENIAVILIHGIGAIKERGMMDKCCEQLSKVRPEWKLDNTVTEIHHGSATPLDAVYASERACRVLKKFTDKMSIEWVRRIVDRMCQPRDGRDIPVRWGGAEGRTICVANAYWGDISLVRAGIFHTIWGMLINTSGLRYFASASLPDDDRWAKRLKKLFGIFVYFIAVFYIPLAVFNIIYSLVTLEYVSREDSGRPLPDEYAAAGHFLLYAVILSFVLILVIWLLSRPAQSEQPLIRHALQGAAIICSVFACLAFMTIYMGKSLVAVESAPSEFVKSATEFYAKEAYKFRFGDSGGRDIVLRPALPHSEACGNRLICVRPLGIFFLWLNAAIYFSSVFIAILSIPALLAMLVLAMRPTQKRYVAGIFLSTASIFAVWFLVSTFLLFAINPGSLLVAIGIDYLFEPPPKISTIPIYWYELVPTIGFVFSAMGLVSVLMVWWLLARRNYVPRVNDLRQNEGAGPYEKTTPLVVPRLLISKWLIGLITFNTMIFISTIFDIYSFVFTKLGIAFPSPLTWVDVAKMAVAFLVLLAVFAGTFRVGLKTWTDVVDHFTNPKQEYPVRRRIASRFTDTTNNVLDKLMPKRNAAQHISDTHLCVIAHSQGTMVVIDKMLQEMEDAYSKEKYFYFEKLLSSRKVKAITIITFGSPFTNVYQHYFPACYPNWKNDVSTEKAMERLSLLQSEGKLRWFNVYRGDDYVGTFINGSSKTFPLNHELSKIGGHTRYWTDDAFEEIESYLPEKSKSARQDQ